MGGSVRLFGVALLPLLLLNSCVNGQELPELPDYFSGYIESIVQTTVPGVPGSNYFAHNLSKQYYDRTMELSRHDVAADALYPGASGLLSVITDPTHKVMYYIQRETRNCTIEPILIPYGGGGIVVDPNGTFHFARLEGLFYLVNTSDYTYAGNFSAHGVVLDNWTYTGDIELTNISYHNVTVDISVARNGAPSTYSSNMGPVPWRISLRGEVTVNKVYNVSLSTVSRFFDLSFEEPHYDVFDISVCAEPKDYLVLVMAVPKNMNQVDYSSYRKNVRQAVVGYTQVLPIQVGGIEIAMDNGTALFTTVQISNLTTKANVPDAVTAAAAVSKIFMNAVGGALPFQIEIASGVMVTPHAVEVNVIDGPQPSSSSVVPFPPSSSVVPSPPSSSVVPSPPSSSAVPSPPSSSVVPSPQSSSVMPSPPMPNSSGVPSSPMPSLSVMPSPPEMSSNVMPSPTTSTTTVTVTVTPSACPTVPVQPPASSAYIGPTPVPASLVKMYTRSYVVGLAFGMIILGVGVTLLSLLVAVLICTRCKKFSFRTGYDRQVNIDPSY